MILAVRCGVRPVQETDGSVAHLHMISFCVGHTVLVCLVQDTRRDEVVECASPTCVREASPLIDSAFSYY